MLITEAAALARELMNLHGVSHWTFELDRAVRRAGCCHQRQKMISLSEHFIRLNNETEVKDTILHEIAHALAGPGHGHDYHWKSICRKIGARPQRCYDGDQVDMPKGKYKATCPGCQKVFYKHRQVRRTYFCTKCGSIKGQLIYRKEAA